MKYRPIHLSYLVVLLLLASCQKEIKTKDGLPLMELEGIELLNTPYAIVKVIPLETNQNNLLGDHLTLKFTENALFIFDENARDVIHSFDRNGNYQGRTVETGQGPGMVARITDFIPTAEGMEILSTLGDQAEIIRFDNNGEIIGQVGLEYFATSIAKLPGGHYVASGSYNLPLVENRLAIINEEGETVMEFLANKHEILPAQEKNFSTIDEAVFFHEIYNTQTYQVTEDQLVPQYQFDFGKYSIPERFFEMDFMAGFELLNQQGFAFISHYWENEDKAFFGVDVQVNGELKKHQVILDKENMKTGKRITSATELTAFFHPVGLMEDHLVFIAQAPDYLSLEADQLPDNGPVVQEGDNPVLLFVEF